MLSQRHHARCACSATTPKFSLSDAERHYERSRPFTIRHLALDLELDFDGRQVSGTATLDFERVAPNERELVLDAVGFEIRGVRLGSKRDSKAATWEYDGDRLKIRIPQRMRAGAIQVTYRAVPRRGLYFLGPDEHVTDRPVQAWTQCQDEDARYWFPCHDKPHVKMTFELRVRVPAGFTVLSNGDLVQHGGAKKRGGTASYHFRMAEPLPSYLVTLVVGQFEVLEDRPATLLDGRKLPCQYLVPLGRGDDGKRSFRETPRMIELFSRLTGVPYPWTRYSQVVVSDFIFGGMENTTATTMYEYILLDERAALDVSSNDLIAHELAHQWFGNYVTCRDWSHGWLNEGFATYLEHVEREQRLGRDEYDYGIRTDLHAYLAEANGRYARPIVCRDYGNPIELFDRHLYEKGGQVLHMLRLLLGDEQFWAGVKLYLTRHARGIVETNDLQRALEEVSGRSLERFFDHWVYRPGHPVIKCKVSYEQNLLSVTVKQTQKVGETPVFAFDLEVDVADKNGNVTRHTKPISAAQDTLVVSLGERPSWVAVDPRQTITGSVAVEAPFDMVKEQLRRGTTARIRWLAAESLSRRDDPTTIAALSRCLSSESEAWMVRVEAAAALGRIRGRESFATLAAQAKTAHPKVRRAIAAALGEFKTPQAVSLLVSMAQKDDSYLVIAEAARAAGRTRQAGALEPLLSLLNTRSWAEVTRAGALDGLAELRDDGAVPVVLEQTRYGHPTRARRAAIMALSRLSEERRVRQHIEALLDDPDPHLRIDAVRALENIGDERCRSALRRQLDRETDGRVARRVREALRDLSDGFASDRKRLSTDIETLQNELSDLRTRLAKLEGGRGKKPNGSRAGGSSSPTTEPHAERPRASGKKPPRRRSIGSKLDERGNNTR
jgi:aminopeptidase N